MQCSVCVSAVFPDTLKGVVLPERGQSVSCQHGN